MLGTRPPYGPARMTARENFARRGMSGAHPCWHMAVHQGVGHLSVPVDSGPPLIGRPSGYTSPRCHYTQCQESAMLGVVTADSEAESSELATGRLALVLC